MMHRLGTRATTGGRVVRPHIVTLCLFAVGSALAMSFAKSALGWPPVVCLALVCTGAWVASGLYDATSRRRRWIGRACALFLFACYALWLYLSVVFGILLAWTVPHWTFAPIALAVIAALATARRPRDRPRVPMVLPIGMWIIAVLLGWLSEETLVRCDDYLALQAPVQLLVPSNSRLASCRPGEIRPVGRYPRTTWESRDGKRLIFTTQGAPEPGGLDGAVCEVRLDSESSPVCIGQPSGKSQGLIEVPEYGKLLAMQWGALGAVIFELPRDGPIAILKEHWFDDRVGEGFYEPSNATLYMFSDNIDGVHRVVLPDFTPAPTIPVRLAPGELRYDTRTAEGIACGHGIGVAIRGAPFDARFLAHTHWSPLDWLSMTWGCDWDQTTRKVYTTIPNLGIVDRLDYDSGLVDKRWLVGPGMRSVAYDVARRRIYMTDFLRGYVVALDEASGRVIARWFIGHFSHWVRLTRDGRALLATSNLGIVRISLDR